VPENKKEQKQAHLNRSSIFIGNYITYLRLKSPYYQIRKHWLLLPLSI
jgi:hypothetical protein